MAEEKEKASKELIFLAKLEHLLILLKQEELFSPFVCRVWAELDELHSILADNGIKSFADLDQVIRIKKRSGNNIVWEYGDRVDTLSLNMPKDLSIVK